MVPGEVAQGTRELGGEGGEQLRTLILLPCGSRPVAGQIERGRQRAELSEPVGASGLAERRLRPVARPAHVIAVGPRERRQLGGSSRELRVMETAQILEQDLQRTEVDDCMMRGKNQQRRRSGGVGGSCKHPPPRNGSVLQIERLVREGGNRSLDLVVAPARGI